MPELLTDGFPEPASRSRFDFTEWADGQAWKFVHGVDYTSSTQTFRHSIKRWARAHGYQVATRPILALDEQGQPLPARTAEPTGLAVRLTRNGATTTDDHPQDDDIGRARDRASTRGPLGKAAL